MEAVFECPDYIENLDDKLILTFKASKYDIRKPSALELISFHDESKEIDPTKTKDLVMYQIGCLVKLGLAREIAEALDINKLKNCFMAMSSEPVKKK